MHSKSNLILTQVYTLNPISGRLWRCQLKWPGRNWRQYPPDRAKMLIELILGKSQDISSILIKRFLNWAQNKVKCNWILMRLEFRSRSKLLWMNNEGEQSITMILFHTITEFRVVFKIKICWRPDFARPKFGGSGKLLLNS